MEQDLGRDAPDVEARPPDGLFLDQGDRSAQVGGVDGGDVAPWARADDDDAFCAHVQLSSLHVCLQVFVILFHIP